MARNREISGRGHAPGVEDVRLGARFRFLRHHLGWRQADIGSRAGVSQDLISLVETGRVENVSLRALRRHAHALGADLRIRLQYRGGELDRLADEGHATLVGTATRSLSALGWETKPEVSYSVYGERGSIDIVAWHADTRTLVVTEVKTTLTSIEETLRRHDAKVRLAAGVVGERFGWRVARVGRLLVLPDSTTARRKVRRHDAVLRSAYPTRGLALRAWLRSPAVGPSGPVGGLSFVSDTNESRGPGRAVSRCRISAGRASAARRG